MEVGAAGWSEREWPSLSAQITASVGSICDIFVLQESPANLRKHLRLELNALVFLGLCFAFLQSFEVLPVVSKES